MKRSRWVALAVLTGLVAGGITWAAVAESRWSARCQRAGGHNEVRYDGTTMMPSGKAVVPVPQYSNHCMVDGREVNV